MKAIALNYVWGKAERDREPLQEARQAVRKYMIPDTASEILQPLNKFENVLHGVWDDNTAFAQLIGEIARLAVTPEHDTFDGLKARLNAISDRILQYTDKSAAEVAEEFTTCIETLENKVAEQELQLKAHQATVNHYKGLNAELRHEKENDKKFIESLKRSVGVGNDEAEKLREVVRCQEQVLESRSKSLDATRGTINKLVESLDSIEWLAKQSVVTYYGDAPSNMSPLKLHSALLDTVGTLRQIGQLAEKGKSAKHKIKLDIKVNIPPLLFQAFSRLESQLEEIRRRNLQREAERQEKRQRDAERMRELMREYEKGIAESFFQSPGVMQAKRGAEICPECGATYGTHLFNCYLNPANIKDESKPLVCPDCGGSFGGHTSLDCPGLLKGSNSKPIETDCAKCGKHLEITAVTCSECSGITRPYKVAKVNSIAPEKYSVHCRKCGEAMSMTSHNCPKCGMDERGGFYRGVDCATIPENEPVKCSRCSSLKEPYEPCPFCSTPRETGYACPECGNCIGGHFGGCSANQKAIKKR